MPTKWPYWVSIPVQAEVSQCYQQGLTQPQACSPWALQVRTTLLGESETQVQWLLWRCLGVHFLLSSECGDPDRVLLLAIGDAARCLFIYPAPS